MQQDNLVVNAWVGVQNGCEITCNTEGKDGAYFTVTGGGAPPFEFAFEAGALRKFIEVGTNALANLEALVNQQDADQNAQPAVAPCCQSAEWSA